jgi:hypothetical protein
MSLVNTVCLEAIDLFEVLALAACLAVGPRFIRVHPESRPLRIDVDNEYS